MSKLFDDASLAMIPSAYKDGKLYSIRPVPEYGAEEVTNGDFATDSDWTKGNGATISGGKANIIGDGSTYVSITQNSVFTTGKKYRVSVDVVINSGLGLKFQDGATNENIGFATSSGTYVFDFTAGANTSLVIGRRTGGTAFNSSVDNVSVKEVLVNGDFDFSRGSNLAATRVDVNGLIEKGRENLLLQSNQFDTTWIKSSGITLTSGQVGYDGTNNAWLVERSAAYNNLYQSNSSFFTPVSTISVYAKAGTYNFLRFALASVLDQVYFNLTDGSVGTTSYEIHASSQSLGNGWWRLSATFKNNSAAGIYIQPVETDGGVGNAGTGSIYIQDAQLEAGLVATDYIETGANKAQAGILEDMPRLDYSGSCPALLLEPQRSNLIGNSEYLNAFPVKLGISVASNATISPDGLANASKLIPDTSNSATHYIRQDLSVSSGSQYVMSFFAKKGEYNYVNTYTSAYSTGTSATWDLNAGAVVLGGSNADIEDYGNGWYRCIWKGTTNSTSLSYRIYVNEFEDRNTSFAGDGVKGAYVYGATLEAGSYSTSYIPTYGTSQTRSIDDCKEYYVDSLLGTDSGTIFVDFEIFNTDNYGGIIEIINDSTPSQRLLIWVDAGQDLELNISSGIGGQSIEANNISIGRHKAAFTYSANKIAYFVDGIKIGTTTPTLQTFAFSRYDMRNSQGGVNIQKKYINQTMAFPTALTDSECIALTTL